MRLLKLKVKNHKRYKLNPELKEFEYKIDKLVQVLLGTNGAGKSGTYGLVFPYPEDHKVLEPGGYVIQEYDHNNAIYRLEMNLRSKPYYSFIEIINGTETELNQSHLLKVQCDLVESTFGITKTIQAILTDKTKFTSMSVGEIKSWLTAMSETDYNYVLGLFTDVKKKLTYTTNVIKHLNKKRTTTLELEVNRAAVDIEESLAEWRSYSEMLISHKVTTKEQTPIKPFDSEAGRKMKSLLREGLVSLGYHTVTQARKAYQQANTGIELYSNAANDLRSKLMTLQAKTEVANVDELPPMPELLESRAKLTANINRIPETTLSKEQINEKLGSIERFLGVMVDLVDNLPSGGFTDTPESLEALLKERQTLTESMRGISTKINKVTVQVAELNHLKTHGEQTCPKCTHQFYNKFDPEALAKGERFIADHEAVVDKIVAKLEELELSITESEVIVKAVEQVGTVYRANTVISTEVWGYVSKHIRVNPASIPEHARSVRSDLQDLTVKLAMMDELDIIERYISMRGSVDESAKQKIEDDIVVISEELEIAQAKLESAHSALNDLKHIVDISDKLTALRKHLRARMRDNKARHKEAIIHLEQTHLGVELSHALGKIQLLESELIELQLRTEIVRDIDTQLVELLAEQQTLKTLVSELSPESGLIGQTLKAFTGTLVENINIYLKKIWTHKFEIQPPVITNGKISYTFPVEIGNNEVPDIRSCSKGEKNAIDMAFKLVLMGIYGFDNYPLILDEFGNGLDNTHKRAAYKLIAEDFTGYGFSNIFLTSHFSELYTIFSNNTADYIVINDKNVDLTNITVSTNLTTYNNIEE